MPTNELPAYRFASYSLTLDALQLVIEGLSITPFRLGQLIDLPGPHNAYHWVNGLNRPNQANTMKILKLVSMVAFQGVKLPLVESINWETGEIIYKGPKNDKNSNGVPSSKRKIPKRDGPYRVPMAELLSES